MRKLSYVLKNTFINMRRNPLLAIATILAVLVSSFLCVFSLPQPPLFDIGEDSLDVFVVFEAFDDFVEVDAFFVAERNGGGGDALEIGAGEFEAEAFDSS